MGADLEILQNMEEAGNSPFVWIILGMDSPASFHRDGCSSKQNQPHIQSDAWSSSHIFGWVRFVHIVHTPYYDYYSHLLFNKWLESKR
jgi:hypothetical protein